MPTSAAVPRWSHIDPAKQLLPRRFDGGLQANEVGLRRIGAIRVGCASELDRIRGELGDEEVEECVSRGTVERFVGPEHLGR